MKRILRKLKYWLFEEPFLIVTVEGNGNRVNQKNCVSGGDIVGGDLYKTDRERDTNCPHCGGPI